MPELSCFPLTKSLVFAVYITTSVIRSKTSNYKILGRSGKSYVAKLPGPSSNKMDLCNKGYRVADYCKCENSCLWCPRSRQLRYIRQWPISD